ncbi:cytochrome c [Pseudohongiella sp.]|uniref:Cytochrome c domain-containing protein n=1 Tax=marine sediment metagenome TaxID=412755 RepID=A0A0F9YAJ8_9ZZZZ|nr:cytochrome c [Pseudohongiella sp.]HDZ07920.1 c-type cytochrome [Pseudohongiella sp.]HEA64473.1 c-type cytochrome [Pseudohongiella sp.]
MKTRLLFVLIAIAGVGIGIFLRSPSVADATVPNGDDAIERGRYLVHAGGCISCHEDDNGSLSGGMAIESPFGTFYASNITPDPDTGIGNWQGRDFLLALKHGRTPDGSFYFPAFPYRAYADISDDDALAIAAYLMSLEPVAAQAPEHDLPVWVGRWQMAGWNLLADMAEPASVTYQDPQIARGAYLTRSLGHCGECHTPRNALGIPAFDQEFAGADMPDGHVEAINPEALANWSEDDLALFLFIGLKPDGDYVGGKMEPVIEHNTGQLSDEDRQAMAAFLKRGQ